MRVQRYFMVAMVLVLSAGCNSGANDRSDADQPVSGAIGSDEVNRYALGFTGAITLDHTGGLICAVADGDLVMDFSTDASDGVYEYGVVADFDAAAAQLNGTFEMSSSGAPLASGPVTVTFGYGPAPDGYEGVVRAAGTISGSLLVDAEDAQLSGSYACFLMDSEVGS